MSLPTPFIYPAKAHLRQHDPQGYDDYRTFKQWLRDEFEFRCVYCLERERWSRSFDAEFSVEHVKPKKMHPELECVYTNLVYACIRCNMAKKMCYLIDPCAVALSNHIVMEQDLKMNGLTAEGKRLIDALHLNEEPAIFVREMYHTILELYRINPRDERIKSLFDLAFMYPDDLPDLSSCIPTKNPLETNISDSHFERRKRNVLSSHY